MNKLVFSTSVYQEPAVVFSQKGQALLIFAGWKKGTAKASSRLLVMKRGVVSRAPDNISVEWVEKRTLEEARLEGHRSTTPCPVYDQKNDKLFLFFTCVEDTESQEETESSKTRLCFITSENLGETWSQVNDLTEHLQENCVAFSAGPGHGLQTESGRLIVPAHVYIQEEGTDGEPVPHMAALYSDDDGEYWQFGTTFSDRSTICQMAEVWENDAMLIYCSTLVEGGLRVEAFSSDNGLTFNTPGGQKSPKLPSSCQGGVVSFPAQEEDTHEGSQTPHKWLLFSHPASASTRGDLGVYVNTSPSDPKAWTKPWVIHRGPSGHSDLAYMGNGCFACVFEVGKKEDTNEVALKIFHYSNIKPDAEGTRICIIF
ncbi:sialidase-3 [Nothobranchius furzeri]|uniref:exo-alpha-sialidase n=1 Tax=Nothobranchius furzeri TaxID=105023 RepID=A0A8C6KWP3_NOTFU|nr:sialidase-3 [Nothobranchius furzeri]KAF7229229.1 sialidase-3-like [Nothobranchius furzeri]